MLAQKIDSLESFREFQHWDKEEIFHDGDSFFARLLSEIDQAQSAIDFEVYIYEDDTVGRALAQKLIEASLRGVKVRTMVDGIGSSGWATQFAPKLAAAGVQTKIYHPLPWISPVNTWLTLFKKINRRNHRKVVLIDNRIAFVGSMNVSACHVASISGEKAWRDSGARVEGELVAKLDEAYEQAWQEAWAPLAPRRKRREWLKEKFKRRLAHRQGDLVRMNFSRTLRQLAQREFLRRIVDAQSRIWITNPYFVPNSLLLRALGFAASRGVDVKLLVPAHPDVFFMHWVAMAFYGDLLKSGVRIFEYEPRTLHAKTFLIDDWASIGSNNLNHRSLIHDLEVDVGLTHESSRDSLEKQFLIDLSQSREVSHGDWKHAAPWARWAGKFILRFKHFL